MGVIYIEGFDHLDWNNDNASVREKWYFDIIDYNYLDLLTPSNTGLGLLHQDFNGDSYLFFPSNTPSGLWRNYTSTQSGIVGFHYMTDDYTTNTDISFFMLRGLVQASLMELRTDSLGCLYWYRASTSLGRTMNFRLRNNEWYYIEVQFYIANSIPANTCKIWVNGHLVLNLPAGTDTQQHATDNLAAGMALLSNTTSDRYWDNIYWARMTGVNAVRSALNSGGGGVFVQTLYPSGTGDFSAWNSTGETSHWRCVDEHYNAEAPDGDTTYLETSNTNDKETFRFGKLKSMGRSFGSVAPTGIDIHPKYIYAAQLTSRMRKTDAPASHFKHITTSGISNIVDLYVTHTGNLKTGYKYFESIMTVNPFTNQTWQSGDLYKLTYGVENIA